jgi:hypothetical protein
LQAVFVNNIVLTHFCLFAPIVYSRTLGLDAAAAARSPIRNTPGRLPLAAAT